MADESGRAVRGGLRRQNIAIPEGTWFLAALRAMIIVIYAFSR